MKKQISIFLCVMVIMMSSAFAQETFQLSGLITISEEPDCDYFVDDTIQLPQITATRTLDTNPSGGDLTYLYCTWGIGGAGQPLQQMSSQNCPETQQQYTFNNEGTHTFTAVIGYGEYSYNGGWNLDDSGMDSSTTIEYEVCYSMPDPSLLQQLLQMLINLICAVFPDLGICP